MCYRTSHSLDLADCFCKVFNFYCPLNGQKLGVRGLDLVFKTRLLYFYCCILFNTSPYETHNVRLSHFLRHNGRLKLATCSLSHCLQIDGSSFPSLNPESRLTPLTCLANRCHSAIHNPGSHKPGKLENKLHFRKLASLSDILFCLFFHSRGVFLPIFHLSYHHFFMKIEINMYIRVYLCVPFFLTQKGSTP